MGLENLRWWHWMLLSIPVGWVLAYVNSQPVDPIGIYEQQLAEFQADLLHAPITMPNGSHLPWVKNVIVYPVVPHAAGGVPAQIVTYTALTHAPGKPANMVYPRQDWFCASVPFEPLNQRAIVSGADKEFVKEATIAAQHPPGIEKLYPVKPEDTLESITTEVYGVLNSNGMEAIARANLAFRADHSVQKLVAGGHMRVGQNIVIPWNPARHMTVEDWLKTVSQNYSWINYRFAWWKVPNNCYGVWMGGTFLVMGVIWPAVIYGLATIGMGPPRIAEEAYDLSRFSGKDKKRKRPVSPKSAEMDEEDRRRLAEMNDSLLKSVGEGVRDHGDKLPKPAIQPTPTVLSQLKPEAFVPKAVEPVVPAPEAGPHKTSKDYQGGEFYPVALPKVKPPDEPDAP